MAKIKHTIEKLKEQVFESKHYGKFVILNEEPKTETSPNERRMKIKFLNTGNEKVVQLSNILNKNVRDSGNPDPSTPRIYELEPLDFDEVYPTINNGPTKIVKDYGKKYPNRPKERMVRIKFINTGYEKDVTLRALKDGYVRDDTIVFGNNTNAVVLNEHLIRAMLRHKYDGMIARCYNPKRRDYHMYGGAGITVCDRWKDSFEDFMTDVKSMLGYNLFLMYPNSYRIDKDYTQMTKPKHLQIYSPETCLWMERYSNDTLLAQMNHTQYNGVTCNVNGFFALIYNANYCNLLSYGPFIDVDSAARFFIIQPQPIEVLNKLPACPIPTPGLIRFKQMTQMYRLI